ncbi:MAG: DUF1624 domain-containing protein [Bacteroidetes bacterium]|nr:MAG: DUF1624 domain-containing protein [Bacteroidota bacterium]
MPNNRLISLDAFRGFTIALMIVVNDPGSWAYVYPPLRHASWHGITPTDFVFPFFLFIVGVSIVLAFSRRAGEVPNSQLIRKIFKRTAIIFGLGLFLALFPEFKFAEIRIPGVLQRIALVFMACSFLFLYTNWRQQAWIAAGLLVGYWLLMALVPVPIDEVIRKALATGEVVRSHGTVVSVNLPARIGEGFIAGNFEPGINLQAWLDRLLVPGRLYENAWDPEGLLSTLPAIGTGLLGMLAGHTILYVPNRERKVMVLLLGGFIAMTIGNVWDWFFPFNKNLWSSSFVMYTGGLSAMTLGTLYWLVDIEGHRRWTWVGIVFGANAITAYVLHGMLGRLFTIKFGSGEAAWTIKGAWMDGLMGWGFSGEFASLLWALAYTALCFLPIWLLYRRKVFIKI